MQKLLVLVTLGLALGGCTALGIIPPDVSLVDLEFTDLTMFETTGEFTIRLANENPDPLRINGGVFRLYLNGVKVGKALTSEPVEVPRLGTATQRVALHVNNVALITRLASLMKAETLEYQIKSRLFVESSYGTRRVNFANSGTFAWGQEEVDPAAEGESEG